jgi:hypothetical protein
VGDMWDTSASITACEYARAECSTLVPAVLTHYCSQLENFLKWNATSLTISQNFGVRFNATCPDDVFMQSRTVGSTQVNESPISSSPSVAIFILIILFFSN